jgi:PAS domain S-box-containing protein
LTLLLPLYFRALTGRAATVTARCFSRELACLICVKCRTGIGPCPEAAIRNEALEGDLIAARNALRDSDARFNTLADALPHMVWSTLPDGDHDYFNQRWYDFTGVTPGTTDGEGWNAMFHPDDRERAWQAWRHSLQTGQPYEIEYRLRHHTGEYRWTLGRALPMRGSDGNILRWIGTCTDIHAAKRQSEQIEVLSRELSHRIKNIFAVIGSLVAMSARKAPQHRDFANRIRQRIGALGRAHEFVRPHSDESCKPGIDTTLHALVREILVPYPAYDAQRIEIAGDDEQVDDRSATPLALLIHELATNATKYGSLSNEAGRVLMVTRHEGEDFVLDWTEVSGPPVTGEPMEAGFGTTLTEISICDQLGGSLTREWNRQGLRVLVRVPLKNLRRQEHSAK